MFKNLYYKEVTDPNYVTELQTSHMDSWCMCACIYIILCVCVCVSHMYINYMDCYMMFLVMCSMAVQYFKVYSSLYFIHCDFTDILLPKINSSNFI
jgi:hypothetical protein